MIDPDAPPAELYTALRTLDDDAFDSLMSDPHARERVVDALVGHFAAALRPDRARDMDAVIQLKLWDRPGGGYDHRELVIADGACRVSRVPGDDADLTLKVRPRDLRDLVSGQANPMRLAVRGRLRVLGDLRLARRIPELFEL